MQEVSGNNDTGDRRLECHTRRYSKATQGDMPSRRSVAPCRYSLQTMNKEEAAAFLGCSPQQRTLQRTASACVTRKGERDRRRFMMKLRRFKREQKWFAGPVVGEPER